MGQKGRIMERLDYIRSRVSMVSDERQDEEWGTEADWACLLDDVLAGARSLDDIGTGGVDQADLDLAIEAVKQDGYTVDADTCGR